MALTHRVWVAWSVVAPAMPDPGDWTRLDVDNPVRAIRAKRGVDISTLAAMPGECIIEVSNANGWLDPQNTASPYSPNVTTWTPIKIDVTDGTTTWDVFNGFVLRWPQDWELSAAWGVVECTDVLGYLARYKSPASELERAVLATEPYLYYPHRYNGTAPTDIVVGAAAAPYANVQFTQQDQAILPFDSAGSTSMASPNGGYFESGVLAPALPLSIMLAVRLPQPVDDWTAFALVGPALLQMDTNGGGVFGVTGEFTSTAAGAALALTPPPNKGQTHLYVVTFTAGGGITVYRDGVSYGGHIDAPPAYSGLIRWGCTNGINTIEQLVDLAHFAVWDKELTATEVADIWRAASTGSVSTVADLAGDRIDHWLDITAIPASRRNVANGYYALLLAPRTPADYTADALTQVRDTALAMDAPLWVGPDGVLQFPGRVLPQPVAGQSFDGLEYKDAAFELTDDMLVTEVSSHIGTSATLSPTEATNAAASGATYTLTGQPEGVHHIDAPGSGLASVTQAMLMGEARVRRATLRKPRLSGLTVMAAKVGAAAAFELDVAQALTASRAMPWGATYTDDYLLTEVVHTLPSGGLSDEATVSVSGVPLPPARGMLYMPNATAGLRASAPLTLAAQTLGALDVIVHCAPGTVGALIGCFPASWGFYLGPDGRLYWTTLDAAGATPVTVSSAIIAVASQPARPVWYRLIYLPAVAGVAYAYFYWSQDGVTWNFVSVATAGARFIRRVAGTPLTVGSWSDGTGAIEGIVFYALVRNANNGPPVGAEFAPPGDGFSSWVASSGETWTVNTTGPVSAQTLEW